MNFNFLCEGQKGLNTGQKDHNTGQKDHNTGQKGLLRVKGQNEAIQDKRAEGAPFWLCFFPWARVESRVEHAGVVKQKSHG